jgi:long-chain acyl-CoA synthetase
MTQNLAKLTPRFLPDLLRDSATRFPDRTAIDFLGAKTSFEDLWTQVQQLAAGLQAKGFQKGDRVGIMLPNCPGYLLFYFATLLAGGVVVNINPLYSPHELTHILNDSDPKFIVSLNLAQFIDKLKPLMGSRQLIVVPMDQQLSLIQGLAFRLFKSKEIGDVPEGALLISDFLHNHENFKRPEIDIQKDLAVLQYTGGTTGLAKAAMLSHANLSINAAQCRAWLPDTADGQECALAVIPFFHVFALTTLVNLSMMMGTTIIALPRFDLKQVLKTIHTKKPTIFPAVPTIYAAINGAHDIADYNLKSINYCVSGGAPLSVEVKKEFERLTGCILVEGFGLSEASPVVCANPINGVNKAGSIGIPFPETTVEIVSLEDKTTIMPQGEKGELCVRGPQVMLGYWQKPLETADVLKEGRLHTGDVATIDKDGYIFIVDRIKDLIISGGYNIYPRAVEDAIYKNDAVEECVCAGIPDQYRGEIVKVWIKLKPGKSLTEADLKESLKHYLSPIEMPKTIDFRDTPLPKTLIGKLSRKALVEEEAKKEKPS